MSVATICNRCCTIQGEENEAPKGVDVHTVQRSWRRELPATMRIIRTTANTSYFLENISQCKFIISSELIRTFHFIRYNRNNNATEIVMNKKCIALAFLSEVINCITRL